VTTTDSVPLAIAAPTERTGSANVGIVPQAVADPAPLPLPVPAAVMQAQAPPPPPATLSSALSAVQQQSPILMSTLERTHPAKWKVKGDERADVEHNFLSVKSDLDQTLPALLADAQKSPQSVDKGLAVYHNVVALNNVLVRLQQTAQIAGGHEDAAILQDALAGVEVVRRELADQIAAVNDDQERALAQARVALVAEKEKLAAAEAAEARAKAARAAAADDAAKKKPVKGAKKTVAKNTAPKTGTQATTKPHAPATGQSQAQ
jgi:hypothetical protein